MLDESLANQLRQHLTKITQPIELAASLDDSAKATETEGLLTQIASLSDNVTYVRSDDHDRRPSFAIRRVGTDVEVRFGGVPLGHEFTSLVLALLQVGGHPTTESDELVAAVQAIDTEMHFETFFSLSCQNCPDVVQALNLMSVLNPRISHTAIDGASFPDEAESRGVMAVPTVFLDGDEFGSGRMTLAEIVGRLDTGVEARVAAEIDAKDPFDVLIVGGGPGGAAAAIYAARKGIRTGLVSTRFGGQVLDTMSIENFISVPSTDGPSFAVALENHVGDYDVDVMNLQTATRLVPAAEAGGPHTVELESGAKLHARTVILATGARWRTLGVPGEDEFRNKGVTYCPHCDGPLFKNKRVAVVGGGNSGAEAAIDLAGVCGGVTLIEFDPQLRADEVLQRKLATLDNVDIITGAATTEVIGDGTKVTGLNYLDRNDEASRSVELDGVFVQIGLVPMTEWLEGTVELSDRGEIVIDDRGRTSVPGVFAAGDATTVAYKQIVIALGAGSTAALSAFDHLIRSVPAPEGEPVA
ncbi:MAG TPA: alkyl hydroperoxide reductase subunit F, partial [Acidimicrobiales bacterium]|nr:alkyl hydroperoxide reductase subunit F [Acidimicrobiales bacterium]